MSLLNKYLIPMRIELSISHHLCDSDIRAGAKVLLRSTSDGASSILTYSPVISYIIKFNYTFQNCTKNFLIQKPYQHCTSTEGHNVHNVGPLAAAVPFDNSPRRWSPAYRYPFHLSSLSESSQSILHFHGLLGFRPSCISRNKSIRSDWP